MAVSKVVRVEDVLEEAPSPNAGLQLLSSSETDVNSKGISESSVRETSVSGDSNSQTLETENAAEAEDMVYPLPEGWPRIKQLRRPMSCSLTTSRMPCVRKAVSHLELIQNIIDEWFKRSVEEARSRSSTRCSTLSIQVAPKKQLRFRDPSTRSTTRTGVTSASHLSSRQSSASLSITGQGAHSPDAPPDAEGLDDGGLDIPYLGAEDVMEEVLTLLARLETDRQDTYQRFNQELETAVTLKGKIDDLCLRRLRELPLLVQREHEACIVDLNELQWHLTYTSRTLAKVTHRKETAELMNKRLHEDIEFVKMHVPLVEEKLVLEVQAMDRIKKAQVETNQELMTTKQRQAKTEQKSTEALNKAETERGHIRRELDSVRDNLTQINEELSDAKMTFNAYVHQVNDIGTQLVDNSQELKVLEVKDKNAKASEEMQATKVRALQAKITDAEFEYRRLENENVQAEEELKVMKAKNAARIAELERKAKVLEGKLRTITRHKQELILDIEDTQEKITRCEQQKIADEKNIRRILREQERVGTMMQATSDEHMSVSSINHHIRDQLHAEQEKAFRTEESLKNTAETLRRQVKEEMHTRTVLQARINSDTAEIDKTRSESAKKKEKADKVADDVGAAVTNVLEKVEKLRSAKAKKDKQKTTLKTQITETEEQHKESLQQFESRLSTIMPHYNNLKDEADLLVEEEHRLMMEINEALLAAMNLADELGVEYFADQDRRRADKRLKEKKAAPVVHISASEGDNWELTKGGGARTKRSYSDKDMLPPPPPDPPFLRRVKEEVGKLDKELEQIEWKSGLMNKKIEEMDAAQGMMDKVSTKTQAAVTELQYEQGEVTTQLESVRKIGEDLKQQLSAVTDRILDGESRHSRFLMDRSAVLHQQDDNKGSSLEKNRALASRYRQLQNEYLILKEQLLRGFDERLKLEGTISDVKQLKSLQSKMHGALTEFFKLNGLYNEGELTRLEQVSAENGLRVGKLQEDMEEALSLITTFLQTEMDGTRARQMAWEAVRRMEEQQQQQNGGLGPRSESSLVAAS